MLLDSDDYPSIRAALDTSLTARQLPDDMIALDIYLGRADRAVKAVVADAESQTGDALARVKAACVFFCASYLAIAMPNIKSKSIGGGDTSISFDIDWRERAKILAAWATDELAAVATPSATTPSRPTMFSVASGSRGF